MDRMRAGLTGLGLVFLSTLAASLVFGPSGDDPAAVEHVKAPGEPLAQLGVAPGIEKDKSGQPIDAADPLANSTSPVDPLADPALADPLRDPTLADPVQPDPAVRPDANGAPGTAAGRQMGGGSAPRFPPDSRTPASRPAVV